MAQAAARAERVVAESDEDEDEDEDDDETGEDLDLELDAEEQAWHKVWADVPTARPVARPAAAAAPVQLSFVIPGVELVKRRELAWSTLAQIDKAIADGRDPSNAVAFGALLAPFIFGGDELRGGDLHGAIQELAHPVIVQLHVTRKDSERLRYILLAQRKLQTAKKKGGQAELAGGRELIDDAVLLFELLERAAGHEVTEVPTVATGEGRDDEGEDDPNNPRKRRRRRRGGRRR